MTHRRAMRLGSWAGGTAILLGLSAGAVRPLVGQAIPVTVGVGAAATGAGLFDLPITLDMSQRAERLGSFRITVRWNPAVLQGLGGVDGSFGGVVEVNDDSLPVGVLHMAGVNPAGATGLITLGVGRFQTLASGATTFQVSVQELYAAATFADLTSFAVPINRDFCGDVIGTWGDLDQSLSILANDALAVLTVSVGLPVPPGFAIQFGDVDGDADTDPRDALIILSHAVGIPNTSQFRVGQATTATCTVPRGAAYGVDPAAATALVGQEVEYYAFGLDAVGAALALRNVTWQSSNGAVASVDGTGLATALGAGTATITARQNDTTIATATLTVVADRTTHWVDAVAVGARNRLGTAAQPFGTVQEALDVATAGDSIRVRSGRYDGATILTPLVLTGDTTAGGSRPQIGREVAGSAALTVNTAGTVVLRDLQVDTALYGINITNADTVRLYHVDVRGDDDGYATVNASGVGLLELRRTRLFGRADQIYYYYSYGLQANGVTTLVVDSSLVADFDGTGIYATTVDTMTVRASTLRNNYGYGIYQYMTDTSRAVHLTVSGSRFVQNYSGAVYASTVRRAAFDHNSFVGGGYTAVSLYGLQSSTILTFLADTLGIQAGPWIYASQYDSALVDSAQILRLTSSSSLYYGRSTVVRNSLFRDLRADALLIYGRGVGSSTALVLNSTFEGAGYSGYGGTGVSPQYVTMVVDSSRFDDVYYGVYGYYAATRVRKSTFDNVQYGIYASCMTRLSVDSVRMRGVGNGIRGYACAPYAGTAMDVDSLDLATGYTGIYTDGWDTAVVRNSRITDVSDGIDLYPVRGEVRGAVVQATNVGVRVDADSAARVVGNAITCGASAYGIEADYTPAVAVDSNAVAGCLYGVYGYGVDTLTIRGNTLTASLQLTGNRGIYSYSPGAGRRTVVGNVLTGGWDYASIYAYDSTYVRVDSNTIANAAEAGIWVDRGDTVLIRDNSVDGLIDAPCCSGYSGVGLLLTPGEGMGVLTDVRRNRIARAANGMYVYRAFADTSTVQLDSNRVYGSGGIGVWIYGYSKVRARWNTLDSNGVDAVRVDRFITGDTTVRFEQNNITRSSAYGFRSLDGGAVLAQNNWWGDPLGPAGAAGAPGSAGDSVSSAVTWIPPLGAPVADAFTAPPAVVAAAGYSSAELTAISAPSHAGRSRPAERPLPSLVEPVMPAVPARVSYPDGILGATLRAADQVHAAQLAEQGERGRARAAERRVALEQAAARDSARAAARAARPEEQRR
jgi:hypothetical protein